MSKRLAVVVFAVFVALFFTWICAAQDVAKEELNTKLKNVREEKARAINDFGEELHVINKESEDKIAKLKEEFRIARAKMMDERQEKLTKVRKEYNDRIKSLIKQETELAMAIGPEAYSNFSKTRTERIKTK